MNPIFDLVGTTRKVKCNDILNLPDINIVIDSTNYRIPASIYVLTTTVFGFKSCSLALLADDNLMRNSITIGAPFLRYYYTSFDQTKRQVCIALANPSPSVD